VRPDAFIGLVRALNRHDDELVRGDPAHRLAAALTPSFLCAKATSADRPFKPAIRVFDLNGHMLRIAKTNDLTPAKHTVPG
jgi:hypothetical protein